MSVPASAEPADVDAAVLGVERSLSGRRWLRRAADDRTVLTLQQRLGVSDIVARVLAGREVGPDEAADFLAPTLRAALPDPNHLLDMDKAVARLVAALDAGERITVFGDYDVDGATSSALLVRYFRAIGVEIGVYIPDRIAEGYGPNAAALERLAGEGTKVLVTVDCGITAHEPLTAGQAAGLDVVVVDHHVAEPRLPPAVAVVNPNRLDDPSPHGQLAAVGVTFLLLVALNRALRDLGRFADGQEPDLLALLDLVALGTVCDVVPLTGINRALVAQGLKVMARRQNIGLRALADVARMDQAPGVYHAGFLLGPRLNAGGRVGEAAMGSSLLTTEDAAAARAMAMRLDGFNQERQALEAAVLADALRRVGGAGADMPVVTVAGEGWHPGVIGIVASRLVERLGRPVCVVAVNDGVGKGSGRSVSGADLGSAVIAARQKGLLINGGGHKMAAGFTVEAGKVDLLAAFLEERLADAVAAARANRSMTLDGTLAVEGATDALCRDVDRVGPFGVGNPEPRFAIAGARLAHADRVGENHVRCRLVGDRGGRLGAIAFRIADEPLGQALLAGRGQLFHVAGRLRINRWQGREEVQLQIEDAQPVTAG